MDDKQKFRLVLGVMIVVIATIIVFTGKNRDKPTPMDHRIIESIMIGNSARDHKLDVVCLHGFLVVASFRGGGFQMIDEKGPIRCKE